MNYQKALNDILDITLELAKDNAKLKEKIKKIEEEQPFICSLWFAPNDKYIIEYR